MRALFALTLGTLLSGCGAAVGALPAKEPSPYAATAVGRLDSAEEARQLVAGADGVISQVLVARGQRVAAGQPLLRVDCAPRERRIATQTALTAQMTSTAQTVRSGARREEIAAGSAQLEAAAAQQSDARDRLDRLRGLIERGFVTKREIEARENGLKTANADVAVAEARLTLLQNGARASEIASADAAARAARAEAGVAQAEADQCVLRSPIDGTVLQILHREGEFSGASQGTPLMIVGDTRRIVARAEINERDALAVHPGQAAIAWVDGRAGSWKGRVVTIASVMGRRSARSLDPTDRFDRDVREVFVAFEGAPPPALVGLRVTVGLLR